MPGETNKLYNIMENAIQQYQNTGDEGFVQLTHGHGHTTGLANEIYLQYINILKVAFEGLVPQSAFMVADSDPFLHIYLGGGQWDTTTTHSSQFVNRLGWRYLVAYKLGFDSIWDMTSSYFPDVSPILQFREHAFRNYFNINEIKWVDGYYWFDIQFVGNDGSNYHFIGRFAENAQIDLYNIESEPFEIVDHSCIGPYTLSNVIDAWESESFYGLYAFNPPVEALRDLL